MNAVVDKKTRKVQQRTLDTRAAITRAALKEFAAVGFAGASTRGIAEAAGVKHTLIAHHFGGKEALWKATAKLVFGVYNERLLKRRGGLVGVDERTVLKLLLKEYILFSAEVPEFHRFMVQASQGEPGRLQWLVDRFIAPGCVGEIALLSAAQEAGIFVKGDPMHLRHIFIGAATSIFTVANEFRLLSGSSAFDESFVDQHVELVLGLFLEKGEQ